MRILFVADGRSPTAQGWMRYFLEGGDEVHLASTFPAEPTPGLASFTFVPLAFSAAKSQAAAQRRAGIWGAQAVGLRTAVRQWLGPLTVPAAAKQLAALAESIRPDLVHALRTPYEGMAAAAAVKRLKWHLPLVVSIWGNDFTFHARSSPLMGWLTRQAMRRADGLHTDTFRDQRLAQRWGFDARRPGIVLPGSGGIDGEVFNPPASEAARAAPVVINPRGVRANSRNDTFFKAVQLVVQQRPEVRFLCPVMAGEAQAEQWVARLGLGAAVELLPRMPRNEMAGLYRQAQVTVSITTHDGTPNSLLEAMACGCFPVVGNIESMHEWIKQGENGFLVSPGDPQALADAILGALGDAELRERAAKYNLKLVDERAEYGRCMAQAVEFYQRLTETKGRPAG